MKYKLDWFMENVILMGLKKYRVLSIKKIHKQTKTSAQFFLAYFITCALPL